MKTRQWNLVSRPNGPVTPENFELVEQDVGKVEDGEILVRMRAFANAPAMREWMDDSEAGTAPPMPLGEPVRGGGVGVITESRHADYSVGDKITGLMNWQEWLRIDPETRWGADGRSWAGAPRYRKLSGDADPAQVLGVLGGNGQAAYFGMIDVIRPVPGETVVVSAAGGSTGSIAGQLARMRGARTIGIASGLDKVAQLTDKLGFDVGVDRRSPTFAQDLAEACPDGIDAYFDNTQGDVLDLCLSLLAKNGRVAMCGGVGVLNDSDGRGNYNLMQVVWKRAKLQGFSIFEKSEQERSDATAQLSDWMQKGHIRVLQDDRHGFDKLPTAFIDLLAGRSMGRQLVWA